MRPQATSAELFQARVLVLGHDMTLLDTRHAYIIVPHDADAERRPMSPVDIDLH